LAGDASFDVYGRVAGDPPTAGRPVAVLLHGHPGSSAALRGLAFALADRGLVVYVPDWASDPTTPEGLAEGLSRAACAIAIARDRDAGSGGRIVSVGVDLGGTAATLLALEDVQPPAGCAASSSARPDGVVGLEAIVDLTWYAELRGVPAATLEAWRAFDPRLRAVAGRAPDGLAVRLFVGDQDESGELPENAASFRDAAVGNGIDVSLQVLAGVDHQGIAAGTLRPTIDAIVALASG
jgi:alpha-beta hydrolase superfamily lysophospholipase